jgi:ABC-type molybdenum transport system ATPase subunit/photorepair protein PhrA
MGWACQACTYHNLNDGAKSCHVCSTARAFPAANEQSTIDLTNGRGKASDMATISHKKRKAGGQLTMFGDAVTATTAKGKKQKVATSNAYMSNSKPAASEARSVQQSLASGISGVANLTYGPISNDPFPIRETRSREILKSVFKIDKLRNQQPRAIENALHGKSQVVVMVRSCNFLPGYARKIVLKLTKSSYCTTDFQFGGNWRRKE